MSETLPTPEPWVPMIQQNMKHGNDSSHEVLHEILHQLRELNGRSQKESEDNKSDPSGDPFQGKTFTTFTAALTAYENRPGRINDVASMSTISIFIAGLSAALLAYASQIFSTRGGYKVTDTLITAGFAFGTFVCLKVAVLNMGLMGQGIVGSDPDEMDEDRLEYFKSQREKFHENQVPKISVDGGRGGPTNKERPGVPASSRVSKTFSDEDEDERDERIMASFPPLDAAEIRFVRKMDRGFGTRLQQVSAFLVLGGAAVLVSLLILAWAELGKTTAILLTCTQALFSASYMQAYFRLRRSRKKIMKRYYIDIKQAS